MTLVLWVNHSTSSANLSRSGESNSLCYFLFLFLRCSHILLAFKCCSSCGIAYFLSNLRWISSKFCFLKSRQGTSLRQFPSHFLGQFRFLPDFDRFETEPLGWNASLQRPYSFHEARSCWSQWRSLLFLKGLWIWQAILKKWLNDEKPCMKELSVQNYELNNIFWACLEATL